MGPLGAESAALAWECLRRNARYREAYGRGARALAFEPGPFPVRIQAEADRAAAPFALLSFEKSDAGAGACFPFFAEAPMLAGEPTPRLGVPHSHERESHARGRIHSRSDSTDSS